MKAAITGTRTARYQTNDYKNKEAKLGKQLDKLDVQVIALDKEKAIKKVRRAFIKEADTLGRDFIPAGCPANSARVYAKRFLRTENAQKILERAQQSSKVLVEPTVNTLLHYWGQYWGHAVGVPAEEISF